MMLKSKPNILLAIISLAFTLQACSMSPTIEPELIPTQVPSSTQIIEPVSTQPQSNLPESEAAVPRVSVEEAKAALESGAAIIVDVRSAEAYEASHIPGAINIPLGEFESNPTDLKLDKEQWIITYCT
jgi:3-mercaptopyruvate sulfurtransferase SseA